MMLNAISVLDGRYQDKCKQLAPIVSEAGLISRRIKVEAILLICLSEQGVIRTLSKQETVELIALADNRQLIERVKEIEKTTRHDVKAVELAIKERLLESSLSDIAEMVHFAVTSEDVNNLAYRLQLKEGLTILFASYLDLTKELFALAGQYRDQPMLARTHGQAAVPTTLGKEFAVYATRMLRMLESLGDVNSLYGKVNGAVGGYNSFHAFNPEVNWQKFSIQVNRKLGFKTNFLTTQINTYEDIVQIFQAVQRINLVILDLNQDMWRYISDNWFKQAVKDGEVGSSVMSHKVNPIDFEGSEGNLQIANSLIEGLVRKLMVSRLQRDLSDSTSIRNLGAVLAYSLIAADGTRIGLQRAEADTEQMTAVVDSNYAVLSEAVQTILRAEGVKDAYSLAAAMTKGRTLTAKDYHDWIRDLDVDMEIKTRLLGIKPSTYLGLAPQLVDYAIEDYKNSNYS